MATPHLVAAGATLPADPLDLVPAGSRIAVAMSGGVDSSVAAARCVAAGFDVVGITLAMWPRDREQDRDRGCCSIDAVDDARRVAATLGIRHYAWNLEAQFRHDVIADFADEYAAGRTPNPCIRCNERIKFGALLERARGIGAVHVATGHYARIGRRGQTWTLHRSVDASKDQSYTLHRLNQTQIGSAVFPLGAMADKAAVRAEALRLGLVTAAKPDSQELCFVDGTVVSDLRVRLAGRFQPGPIADMAGTVIGTHEGLPFYTVGQRSRLNVAPRQPDAEPLYVIAIEADVNRIVVGPREALRRDRIGIHHVAWVAGAAPASGTPVHVQLRAHGQPHPAEIASVDADVAELMLTPGVLQVAPGQAAVIYDATTASEVIGGGIVAWAR